MTDNLRIWNAVQKTNPANTKKVTQRGGFTSICAQSQIMEATRQFGPIGEGWGYIADEPIFHDNLVFVRVELWHGDRRNIFGPVTGGAEWKNNKGYLDSDAPKKATTDALTKLLSQLGFNADVFLGLYDDNKYVEQVKRAFADAGAISEAEANAAKVLTLAEAAGVPVQTICETYNVSALNELTAAQVASVTKRLNLTIADTKKEAA